MSYIAKIIQIQDLLFFFSYKNFPMKISVSVTSSTNRRSFNGFWFSLNQKEKCEEEFKLDFL